MERREVEGPQKREGIREGCKKCTEDQWKRKGMRKRGREEQRSVQQKGQGWRDENGKNGEEKDGGMG